MSKAFSILQGYAFWQMGEKKANTKGKRWEYRRVGSP